MYSSTKWEWECGTEGVDTSREVVGYTAWPGTYPSGVLLGRNEIKEEKDPFVPGVLRKVERNKYICGGTLINRSAQEFLKNLIAYI
jgi:hypothetical protein